MSETERHAGNEKPPATYRVFSNFSGNVALLVSVFALALGAYQTRVMQGEARASVWPFLSIGYSYSSNVDKEAFIWTINNNGVGPARVESVILKLDDKPMRRWDEALAALGAKPGFSSAISTLSGEVIPPNTNRETTIQAIKINEREVGKLFKDAEKRFQMDICYCSVYDECWIAHWHRSKVDPVDQCDTTVAQFEQ